MKEYYKQRLREARGEPDTSELDRQLRSVDDAFIAGYPRGPMHRAEVARNERVRGRINPNRPQSLEMSLASDSLMPAELVRSFLDLNKDQAAELEERPRSKSKGDPRKDPEVVQTGRMNADAFAQLSTFPTRSNPPGTIPAHLANNPALVAHHQQANSAWRYSPTGETEYYDPTRHPTNPAMRGVSLYPRCTITRVGVFAGIHMTGEYCCYERILQAETTRGAWRTRHQRTRQTTTLGR